MSRIGILSFAFLSCFVLTASPQEKPRAKISDPSARERFPMGATVSVSELRIPAAAQKELRLFQQSLQAGNLRDSVKHLSKAIQIYPQIPAAHQNLGACYVRLSEYEKAVAEFQKASEMDTHMLQPELGLATAYLLLGRSGDAEAAARRALDIDPINPTGRYLLGRALAFEGRDTPETEELLRKSFAQYPASHLALAGILLKRNALDEAVAELREYIAQPDTPQEEKETVGCAIEKLAQPTGASTCASISPAPVAQN